MPYNLYAVGDLDYVALSRDLPHAFELFPIAGDGGSDALGIVLPTSRADAAAETELRALLEHLHLLGVRVHDLWAGVEVETAADVDALCARIFGDA